MVKKYTRIVLSLTITFVAFIFLFRNISFDQVFTSMIKAEAKIILFATFIAVFNGLFISSFRWKLILNKMDCDISWKEALFIKAGSDPIVSVMPFKTGEISRILYLKHIKNILPEKTIFSILIEYFLNFISVLFFIFLGGVLWLFQGGGVFLNSHRSLFFCSLVKKKVSSENKWMNNLRKFFQNCFKNRKVFLNKKVLFYSFLMGFFELVCVYLIFQAMNISVPLFAMLIYVPLIILFSSIPITFLGLGIRESLIVFLFLKYASSEKLLAAGILYSFAESILPMLINLSFTPFFINKIITSREEYSMKIKKHNRINENA